ncbi:hypothetical protein DPMN_118250 [Dreissena polymorpha]|uniref:Uncharacterized protein n=1 Tax=Dreissena polymorpha TaxID=45954 RepID=A0A9D4GGE8_DREPO|nr:hypothetical protein DPMN_118250 [Dreissena polymorpha]
MLRTKIAEYKAGSIGAWHKNDRALYCQFPDRMRQGSYWSLSIDHNADKKNSHRNMERKNTSCGKVQELTHALRAIIALVEVRWLGMEKHQQTKGAGYGSAGRILKIASGLLSS